MEHDPFMAQLTPMVEELLKDANVIAESRGHGLVGTEHLLLAMTQQSDASFARRLLDDVGATDALRAQIEEAIGPS